MRARRSKVPASPTDVRSLIDNFPYPLMVCAVEGQVLFYNSPAHEALGIDELLGKPLPEDWKETGETEIETANTGRSLFYLRWEEIIWEGNDAWYLVAVPSLANDDAEEKEKIEQQALEFRRRLEESQEMRAVQSKEIEDLRLSQEEVQSEAAELKQQLQAAEEMASEIESLRRQLEQAAESKEELSELQSQLGQAESAAADAQELRARLQQAQERLAESDGLKEKLEQSVEMAAVETEKRQAAESEREKLEAKLRDLHQRSLSKLEAARNALETERTERGELSDRLERLKSETDELKSQLQQKAGEIETAQQQSGDMEVLQQELQQRIEDLQSRDSELAKKNQELVLAEQQLEAKDQELEQRRKELGAAEDRADRYRKEYEELDKEMVNSQERSALLSAKLQSVELRMERYQRLMDREPNEFARGDESQEELEGLRNRVEELEVELAATTAAARFKSDETEAPQGDTGVSELEAECQKLRGELSQREQRIAELETSVASTNGTAHSGADPKELADLKAVLDEVRFRRDLEFQEAQENLRQLQERYASVQVDGVESGADPEELEALNRELSSTKAEIQTLKVAAESVPQLQNQIQVLEVDLREALVTASTAAQNQGAAAQLQVKVQALEAELQRARSEASPEELQLARRRISELEAELASRPQQAAEGEMVQQNQQLAAELNKTREQLAEMNNELRRTLEGDRETKKLAYADQLTGLPNLNLTGQYLQFCFERSGKGEGALALILIDLDHFRRVNDALGQKAGDHLLREVGARLQRAVTEKDTAIARRGEDEFMVVAFMEGARVDGEQLTARVRGIAHNLLNELARPFEILGQQVQVTASLGVALYPGPAQTRIELLEQAEHAMYRAKETGRARVNFYTEELHNNRERKRYMENELRQGIAHGQFGMVYQPIYDLTSSKVVGVEALLRWSHPHRGVLEPAEFLEVAEDSGAIVEIGESVIPEALAIASQKFMKKKFLSLNLSFRQLIDTGFAARFMRHLQVAGVPPHEVIVEVSEKASRVDPDRIKNTLAHLAHWGVGVALDDFGTGHSELTALSQMTLRVLKIDTSLVAKITEDRDAAKFCHAITQLSQAMEIPVLAEGVESKEQLQMIGSFGCKYAQGHILGPPMNVNQLVQVL